MDLYISAPETLVVISLEHAEEVNLLRLRDCLCTRQPVDLQTDQCRVGTCRVCKC